jgi:hypothetical protein
MSGRSMKYRSISPPGNFLSAQKTGELSKRKSLIAASLYNLKTVHITEQVYEPLWA